MKIVYQIVEYKSLDRKTLQKSIDNRKNKENFVTLDVHPTQFYVFCEHQDTCTQGFGSYS